MACGHCVAVCLQGELNVIGVDIEDYPEIDKDLLFSWDQAGRAVPPRSEINPVVQEPDHGPGDPGTVSRDSPLRPHGQ